jgi:uncharacterized membrane protein
MSTTSPLQRTRTVRTAATGLLVVGGVLLGVLTAMGRPLAAVAAYLLAVGATVTLQVNFRGTLVDERDRMRHLEASGRTLQVVGITAAGVFPTLTVLWGLGYFQWRPWAVTLAFAVAALYGVYGAIRLWIAFRGR